MTRLAACTVTEKTDELIVGQPFPSITLTDLTGKTTSLETYKGRLVILNVWATWCEACRDEMPSLQRLSEQLEPSQFAVLGLSLDEEAYFAKEYMLDKKINFKSYIDNSEEIANQQLKLTILPTTFIIDTNGVLLKTVAGERQWDTPEMIESLQLSFQSKPFVL